VHKLIVKWLLFIVIITGSFHAYSSDKKGVGLAAIKNGAPRIEALNLAWYYTWRPNHIEGVESVEFIPMIWGGKQRLEREVAILKAQGKVDTLLVINEPNKRNQAHMSAQKVVDYWPELASLTNRISSPAPAGTKMNWLDAFNKKMKKNNYSYSFLAVHIYGPPNAETFLARVDNVYNKYKKPLWITEFAVADWSAIGMPLGTNRYSEQQVLEFMKAVLPELEKRDYVERYAWYGAGKNSSRKEQVRTSRLFEKDGSLSELGRYYANFNYDSCSDD